MSWSESQLNRVAELTDAQLRCLRLVPFGSSKRIAQRLGISHNTVNLHIGAGMAKLGVHSRHEAAEIVAAWDSKKHTSEPSPVGTPPVSAILDEQPSPREAAGGAMQLHDVEVPYDGLHISTPPPPHSKGGPQNEQSGLQITLRIVGLAAAIAILGSAAKPLGEGFQALADVIVAFHSNYFNR